MLNSLMLVSALAISAQPSGGVSLWGELTPTRVRLGDVVFMEVSACNNGSSSVKIPATCLLETGSLIVEITDREQSTTFRFLPDGGPAAETPPRIDLAPGKTHVLGVFMLRVPRLDRTKWRFWDCDQWRSGDYYLNLRCAEFTGRSEKLFIDRRPDEEMGRLLAFYDAGLRTPVPAGWDIDRPGLGTFGLLTFPTVCSRPEKLAALERTLGEGSLRDCVHVTRLTVQVYDCEEIDDKRKRARELLEWIDSRPKLQRAWFSTQLTNWAKMCRAQGEFMSEFVKLIETRAVSPAPTREDNSSTKEASPPAPLRLELSVADSEILQHEPVVVSVRLTNVSTENVELDPRFEQIYLALQFNLSDPYGRSFPHRWIAHADGPASWRPLGPGKSIVHRQWLFFGMRRHEYFEFPGEYRIDASFITPSREGPTLTLRSEPVDFQVRRTPPSEVDAWDVFRGTAREAMGAAEPAKWMRSSHLLDGIAYNWPRSRYAPWSLFFLGRGWQLRQGKYQDRARREAAAAFETLVADYPDFPMAIEARYCLAKARYELEPTSEKLKVIETMIEQHPDLWLMRCAKEQIGFRRDGAAPSRPVSLP